MPMMPAGQVSLGVAALLRAREGGADAAARSAVAPWPLESVDGVLARRRAVRQFAGDPADLRDVTTIAARARAAERALWPAGAHGTISYTLLVAAFRVTGLVPGLYLAQDDATAEPFTKLADIAWLDELRDAYADAAFLLLICADIPAACRIGGPGYGPLLIRAGTIGHGAWLTGVSLGLTGCLYAAPHHRVTQAIRQVDGRSNHVFTASLGRAPA